MASLHRKWHHSAFTHLLCEHLNYYYLVCKHLTQMAACFLSPVSLKLASALEHGVEEGWRNDCWERFSPLPSPKIWVTSVFVAQSYPTLCNPMGYSQPSCLSMEFSRQENWTGLSCPPPGDLPNPGIEPTSLTSPALAGRIFTNNNTWEAHRTCTFY